METIGFAAAKINLALHVTGQRADGYHLLDTLVTFADFGDHLEFASSDNVSLEIDGPEGGSLKADANNLILRAARGLQELTCDGSPPGAHIRLTKNLPVSSGIGGGSADAAATLRGLCELWGLQIPSSQLHELAISLGADVPMCLFGKSARVTGIGETLEPIELPQLAMVLINPRIPVSTPKVFGRLACKSNPPMDKVPAFENSLGLIDWLADQRNDLQSAACSMVPEILECLSALETNGAQLARMSGSGATCFGVFADLTTAQSAASALADEHPEWWIAATRTGTHQHTRTPQ